MTTETRYMRSDTALVNGLTTEKLLTSQSGVAGYKEMIFTDAEAEADRCYLGIRVWKRTSGGVETEITLGTPIALVYKNTAGDSILNAAWNCPLTALSATDSVIVRVYTSLWDNIYGFWGWQLLGTWQTEQLGASSLDAATWTVYYYLSLGITMGPPKRWIVRFRYDTITYNSRIENFQWSVAVAAEKTLGDGLTFVTT